MLWPGAAGPLQAQPTAAAVAAFRIYSGAVEARLARQHSSADGFLAPFAAADGAGVPLRQGGLLIEQLTPHPEIAAPGALLHHWRGTAFVPGATPADFERVLRDLAGYPTYFSPEVLQARVTAGSGDHLETRMRVRQTHVLTVVMDTAYDVVLGRLDPRHGFVLSRSTQIAEIEAPGTDHERRLNPAEEHGFLWRLNTYWSYEEQDGGLYLQMETVSLTRSLPTGLGWLAGPLVERLPRESMQFTLRSMARALRAQPGNNHPN